MGFLQADPDEKKAYYQKQSQDLSRQAQRVATETGNQVEASRLAKDAQQAAEQAQKLDQQLDNVAKNIRNSG